MPYVEIGYIIEGVCQSKGSIESVDGVIAMPSSQLWALKIYDFQLWSGHQNQWHKHCGSNVPMSITVRICQASWLSWRWTMDKPKNAVIWSIFAVEIFTFWFTRKFLSKLHFHPIISRIHCENLLFRWQNFLNLCQYGNFRRKYVPSAHCKSSLPCIRVKMIITSFDAHLSYL